MIILYMQWISFCTDLHINHMLQDHGVPAIETLQVYTHRLHHGHYSKQSSARADSVATVWRTIIETHLLEGLLDPQKPFGSATKDLDKRLLHMTLIY